MKPRAKRGPSDSYDNPEKNQWREWVWNHIAAAIKETSDGPAPVLFMPSIEGHEIEAALSRGLSPGQCHVVDDNPANVATLSRRFPGIVPYGVGVDRACKRIAQKGVTLMAANIDFCGRISKPLLRALAACWDSGALDDAWVFVTVLRGREDALEQRLMPMPVDARRAFAAYDRASWWVSHGGLEPTLSDEWRIWSLHQASGGTRTWAVVRAYCSPNGQSFLTVVFPPRGESQPKSTCRDPSLAGDPIKRKCSGLSFSEWRRGLTLGEKARLAATADVLGVCEQTAFNIWRQTEDAA